MISAGFSQQRHPVQQFAPLGLVILLHIAFFFALQNGLSQHAKQPETTREIIATLIPAQPAPVPKELASVPQPARPQVQSEPPKPQPAPRPVKQHAAKPAPAPTPEPTPKSITRPAEPAPTASPAPSTPAPSSASAPAAHGETSASPSPSQSSPQPKTITSGLEYISQPPREYPAMSRRLGEEGTVTLRILVNDKGQVDQVEIRKSSGFPRLDEAARKWAQRIVFKPYMENGRPIPVYANLPISFNLDS